MSRTADLTAAVEHALRAPSVHNTQPWRWRIRPDAVELHADWDRHLVATDPDRRDLVISCGAALHHLEVALAARGLTAQVRRMPDRRGPRPPRDRRGPFRSGGRTRRRPVPGDRPPADRSAPHEPPAGARGARAGY